MTSPYLSVERRAHVTLVALGDAQFERLDQREDRRQAEAEILVELRAAVAGAREVVVDVRRAGTIRPSTLSLSMRLARELRMLGIRAAICGGPEFQEVWYVCRAGKLADVYVDLATAIDAARGRLEATPPKSLPTGEAPPASHASVLVVDGDLLDQAVDVIVNAWNRNVIPWWLLWPQGVSGAIKRRAGLAPFRELAQHGPIPLGGAVATSAGRLPFKAIIHVAGINLLWRSSERSVRDSVRNALALATSRGDRSIALPLIGAGSGGGTEDRILALMLDELDRRTFAGQVVVVRFRPNS